MERQLVSLDVLERQVQALASAESPSAVFRALLDGARFVAPRAAVFLVRGPQIRGWGSLGYDSSTAAMQRGFTGTVGNGWLGELASEAHSGVDFRRNASGDPDFGQSPAAESVGIAVRLKRKPIAVLMLERSADEVPWFPELLSMFVAVAQLRLELDLIRKKLGESQDTEVGAPAPIATLPVKPVSAPIVEEDSPVEVVETGSAGDPEVSAARRFARLVATDIRLYNEEAVLLGRRHGDLVNRLAEHLDRGKETFLRRHGELGPVALQILHQAYVQVLAAGDANLLPASVLD
ncbi:MAG TPA: hypothetical protein VJS92_01740 [Candidatus Polarisedimenticolaceae bacterium]|nr:hypothetical protein [Candidatus Polarisedimenticolaceae bacterium]